MILFKMFNNPYSKEVIHRSENSGNFGIFFNKNFNTYKLNFFYLKSTIHQIHEKIILFVSFDSGR